MTNSSSPLNM